MVRHRFAKPAGLITPYGFESHTLLYLFGDITVIGNGLDWKSSAPCGQCRFESYYLRYDDVAKLVKQQSAKLPIGWVRVPPSSYHPRGSTSG